MKPEQELVLSIYEGQNWQPRVGYKAMVRAKLGDKNTVTDKEELNTKPLFNTQLAWQIKPEVMRRYKLEKVPIRVECLSISPNGKEELLGYIILPLNTAVAGIEIPKTWHKLLGGPLKKYKSAPQLLMSLELNGPEENKVEKGGTAKTKVKGRRGGYSLGSNTLQDLPLQPPRRASFHEIKEEPDDSYDDYTCKENGSPSLSEVLPNGRRFKGRNSSSESPGRHRNSLQDLARDVSRQQSNMSTEGLVDEGTSVFRIKTENGIEDDYDFSGFVNGQIGSHNFSEGNMSGRTSRGLPGGSGLAGLSGYHSFSDGNISGRAKRGLPGVSGTPSQAATKVQAYFNDTMSFFQIGPSNHPDEESFIMSVVIVYAKNLEQLFPRSLLNSQDPAYFGYNLLGCAIKTDTIDDIFDPSFGAQQSDVNIRSTPSNLSVYFNEQHQLPIHLLIGDMCLASTSVSLSSFCNLDELSVGKPSCQQGQYPLVPIVVDAITPGREPILGVMVQINRVSLNLASPRHPAERVVVKEEVLSSSCDAEDSDDDDGSPLVVRSKRNMSLYKNHQNQEVLASEIHKQRTQLLCAAACEVETWKDNLQEVFWKQWTARENELQNHLAAEWRIRLNSIESHLDGKMQKCDTLQSRLTSALSTIAARESGVRKREMKLEKLEEELQKQQHMLKERDKNPAAQQGNSDVWEELMVEKHNRRRLEKKVAELQGKLIVGETQIKEQEGSLEEAQQICKKNEVLSEKLRSIEVKKQYYKLQWVRAVSQLHQMYVAQAQDTLTIRSEVENGSPEPFASSSMINTAEDPHHESLLFLESQTDAAGPSKPYRRRKSNPQLSVNQDRMRKRNLSELDSSESSETEPRRHTFSSKTPVRKERRRQQNFSANEVHWLEQKAKSSRRISDSSSLVQELDRFRNDREELLRSTDFDQYEAKIKNMNREMRELMGT